MALRILPLIVLAVCCRVSLAVEDFKPHEVEEAIKKAKAFIYSQQQPDGTWSAGEKGENAVGYTALPVYALLAAGESANDPRLKKAIDWLLTADTRATYSAGVRLNVWNLVPRNKNNEETLRKAVARDLDALLKSTRNNGNLAGKYTYGHLMDPRGSGVGDNSNSQYGLLGVWAASQFGAEIGADDWRMFDHAWRNDQNKDGGWGYSLAAAETASTASMTAAGVASLFIVLDELYGTLGTDCKGNVKNETTEAIERGLKWMSDNFAKVSNNYTWYGVERIGVASGLKYFGKVDWYKVGAARLLKDQKDDGGWGVGWGSRGVDASFALLFLVRGRAPVVMNKLQYAIDGKEGNWNERPRDVSNVTKWISDEFERPLNWQILDLKVSVDELHDAPILYISGNEALTFTADEVAKLRQYIEEGGMIVANADCKSPTFAKSIQDLGHRLFPMYEFRDLPKDHPIYTNQTYQRKNWKKAPDSFVRGLSNGARELILLFPGEDPARLWATRSIGGNEHLHQVMSNILLYATGRKDLRYKGDIFTVRPDPAAKPAQSIKLARLEYRGNWNPEPAGFKRLAAILRNANTADLQVDSVKLGDGKLGAYKVAHLTGTDAFTLNEAGREELRRFLAAGGTLIVDAAGGSGNFAIAVEKEIQQILPDPKAKIPQPIANAHPMLKADNEAFTGATYRNFARRSLGPTRALRLMGYNLNGRTAIFYSREDLSVGLLGNSVDGIIGYEPATAVALMRKMILHAAPKAELAAPGDAPAPATKPADPVEEKEPEEEAEAPAEDASAPAPAATTAPAAPTTRAGRQRW